MSSTRLLIVSHRLPVTARPAAEDGVHLTPAGGGLATGLRPWHEASGGVWIGWPGDVSRLTGRQREQIDLQLGQRAIVLCTSREIISTVSITGSSIAFSGRCFTT